jgi:hypothetical protein
MSRSKHRKRFSHRDALQSSSSQDSDYSDDSLRHKSDFTESRTDWECSRTTFYSHGLLGNSLVRLSSFDPNRAESFVPQSSSVFDHFVHVDVDLGMEDGYSTSACSSFSHVEAAEWRDVLAYFCGSLQGEELNDTSKPVAKTVSLTSLFRE